MNNWKKNKSIFMLGTTLMLGAIIVLLGGKRQPLIYAEKNEMNYEVTEEQKQEENTEVVMEEETTFSTEEQKTEEKQTDSSQSTKKNNTETQDKKPGGKKKKGDNGKKTIPDNNSDNTKVTSEEEKKMTSLSIAWAGNNELLYGKDLDRSAIQVTGHYNTGETERIPIEDCSFEGFDAFKLGKATCTIGYYGLKANATYTILNYETGITCVAWGKKDAYRYGDEFSKSDLSVVVDMADGTQEPLAANKFEVQGVDTKQVGQFGCRILYKDFSVKNSYTVINYPVALSSSLKNFVIRGDIGWGTISKYCDVTATMADGSLKALSPDEYSVSGFQNDTSSIEENFYVRIQYEDVDLYIPYEVYSTYVWVDVSPEKAHNQYQISFTKSITIKDIGDLGVEKTVVRDGVTYELEGVYRDAKHKKPWKGPETFEAEKEYKINSPGLEFKVVHLYAQYKEVKQEEKPEDKPQDNPEEKKNNKMKKASWFWKK